MNQKMRSLELFVIYLPQDPTWFTYDYLLIDNDNKEYCLKKDMSFYPQEVPLASFEVDDLKKRLAKSKRLAIKKSTTSPSPPATSRILRLKAAI
jgi:hypothetical protein